MEILVAHAKKCPYRSRNGYRSSCNLSHAHALCDISADFREEPVPKHCRLRNGPCTVILHPSVVEAPGGGS